MRRILQFVTAAMLMLPLHSETLAQERNSFPVASLKTNLPLPLLNLGVEVPVHNRISIEADIYYPWCKRSWLDTVTASGSTCFQLLATYLSVNFWLGSIHSRDADRKYRLRGHSIGIVGGAAKYDFEFDFKGNQGEAYAIGLGYRYALPLGRGACHMDFDLAVGVISNFRHPYTVHSEGGDAIRDKDDDSNQPIRTVRNIMYGYPMKAGISLVIPITVHRK